jgi:hypothetical protein
MIIGAIIVIITVATIITGSLEGLEGARPIGGRSWGFEEGVRTVVITRRGIEEALFERSGLGKGPIEKGGRAFLKRYLALGDVRKSLERQGPLGTRESSMLIIDEQVASFGRTWLQSQLLDTGGAYHVGSGSLSSTCWTATNYFIFIRIIGTSWTGDTEGARWRRSSSLAFLSSSGRIRRRGCKDCFLFIFDTSRMSLALLISLFGQAVLLAMNLCNSRWR